MRVFENMMMREIFGPNWEEVTGDRRELHSKELRDLYCSKNIIGVTK
jgi:hypothetical protein